MVRISTFVFFDIETTGFPWQERNRTKITDFSLIATAREDLETASLGEIPPVSKLCFPLQPEREIHQEVVKLTGITNESLKNASKFHQKVKSILTFLEELPKPVCLVAHNGNIFDYKILLAEFNDANSLLPQDLLCVDSLVGFRRLLKHSKIDCLPKTNVVPPPPKLDENNLLTDDEDDWPDLNVTLEDWNEIDELCESLSDISTCDSDNDYKERTKQDKREAIRKVFDNKSNRTRGYQNRNSKSQFKKKERNDTNSKGCYSLSVLYKMFLNKEEVAHRAEVDCLMLLHCIIAIKQDFIPWADNACKLLTVIKPLHRY